MRYMAAILLGVGGVTGCATPDSRKPMDNRDRRASAGPANTSGEFGAVGATQQLALDLWREGKHEKACQLLRRTIAQSPDDVGLRLTLARVLMDDNRLDDASAELNEITRRRPQSAAPHVLWGYVHHRRGDTTAAERAFRSALQRVGQARERIAAFLGLGAVLEATGRQAEADRQYAAAIALSPDLRTVLIDIQKRHLMPPPVTPETGPGEVSPTARLREMEKILRRMDEQK